MPPIITTITVTELNMIHVLCMYLMIHYLSDVTSPWYRPPSKTSHTSHFPHMFVCSFSICPWPLPETGFLIWVCLSNIFEDPEVWYRVYGELPTWYRLSSNCGFYVGCKTSWRKDFPQTQNWEEWRIWPCTGRRRQGLVIHPQQLKILDVVLTDMRTDLIWSRIWTQCRDFDLGISCSIYPLWHCQNLCQSRLQCYVCRTNLLEHPTRWVLHKPMGLVPMGRSIPNIAWM